MKVLICGEYGIYCRELISRLKKEKHDIFVITGSEKARREKPRSGVFQEYNFSYRSKNIGTIMKNVQADVLLIMGICDTKFTWQDINQESVRYLTSITNILMSAKEAGIKQVIYCSSLGIDVYKRQVVNNGNVTISGITVNDDLTGGQWTIDSLEPNGTQEFTTDYVVTEADILAGQVVNVAAAGGTAPDGSEVTGEGTEIIVTESSTPHLSISKETTSTPANGETYALGETITYSIVATNDGNLTLTNVVVRDELTGDEWTIDSLAPGASSETFTAEHTVTSADILNGSVLNVATAGGETPDPDKPDPGVDPGEKEDPTVDPNPSVAVVKEVTSTPAVSYTHLQNQ